MNLNAFFTLCKYIYLNLFLITVLYDNYISKQKKKKGETSGSTVVYITPMKIMKTYSKNSSVF